MPEHIAPGLSTIESVEGKHARMGGRTVKFHGQRWLALMIGACLMLMFGWVQPGNAQSTTTLAINPTMVTTGVNQSFSIDLVMHDGLNLNAYDIILEYDPSMMTLTQWNHGSYMSNLAVVFRTQEAGYFRLVCTQLATPGVSGNGVLLKLTFNAHLPGTSEIVLSGAEFADSGGELVLPTRVNGQVQIQTSLNPTATLPLASATAPAPTATTGGSSNPTSAPTAFPPNPGYVTATLPFIPAGTQPAAGFPIDVEIPETGTTAIQPQNSGEAQAPALEPSSTSSRGRRTDPIFIPVRTERPSEVATGKTTNSVNGLGIALIVIFDAAALGTVLFLFWKRKKKKETDASPPPEAE